MADLKTIDDVANLRAIPAAVAAQAGAIALENVAGTLKQVDDQGTATNLGGGGTGTVTSVAATAGGLLAVAGTPTVAPTVGLAAAAAATVIGNPTGGSAVPVAMTATQLTAQLNAATTSLQGAMSATDKAAVTSLEGTWESRMATFLTSKLPALTGFRYKPVGLWPAHDPTTVGFPTADDGAVEGGGFSPAAAQPSRALTQSMIQLPKTGTWAYAFRAKFAAVSGAHIAFCGLSNGAASHYIDIGLDPTNDATHFVVRIIGGASTRFPGAVRDTAVHDHALTMDGTTLTYWLDGASQVTITAATYVSTDEPMYFWHYNTVFQDGILSKLIIGIIEP